LVEERVVPVTDENTVEVAQQFISGTFASGIMVQKIDRKGRRQCPQAASLATSIVRCFIGMSDVCPAHRSAPIWA